MRDAFGQFGDRKSGSRLNRDTGSSAWVNAETSVNVFGAVSTSTHDQGVVRKQACSFRRVLKATLCKYRCLSRSMQLVPRPLSIAATFGFDDDGTLTSQAIRNKWTSHLNFARSAALGSN